MSVDIIARALAIGARPASYMGLVATRVHIPSLANASHRQLSFRRWHIARDDVASVQVAFPNWLANNVAGEAGSGGTARFRAAFGAGGDGVEYAMSGLADRTLGGAISTSQISLSFGPCLIVGRTRRPSLALLGDSRVKGGASAPGIDSADASGDLGELARSFGPHFAYVNCGTSSERLNQFLSSRTRRIGLAAHASHIVANYAINDLIANRNAADILGDIAAFAALPELAGKPVAWTTVGPRSSSTDGWSSVAGQTPFAQEAARRTVNTALRARRVRGLSDVFDCAAAYESAIDSGRYAVGDAGESLTADGLHLSSAGTRRIQRSGLVDPGRITR